MIIALKSCIVPNFFYDTEEAGERRDLPPLSLKFFFLGYLQRNQIMSK